MKPKSFMVFAKLALIPLLGAVLLYVLMGRPKTSNSISFPASSNATSTTIPTRTAPKPSNANQYSATEVTWPTFSAAQIIHIDPFDRRRVFPEIPKAEATNTNVDGNNGKLVGYDSQAANTKKSESLKIQAIYQSPQGIAALVGDRIIRIGDRLDDGSRVTDITADKIVVDRPRVE
jgi:hypothetical protein